MWARSRWGCHSQVVLGQTQVSGEGGKNSEITAFAPLLDRIDLSDVLLTADALHTQRGHADYLHHRGGHYLLIVKANQCATRRSVTFPPQVGQTRREVCWVRWLTWIRKVKGTRACRKTTTGPRGLGPGVGGTGRVGGSLIALNLISSRRKLPPTGTQLE